jgi:hypothetical protein
MSQFNDWLVTVLQHGAEGGFLPMEELFLTKNLWL